MPGIIKGKGPAVGVTGGGGGAGASFGLRAARLRDCGAAVRWSPCFFAVSERRVRARHRFRLDARHP